MKYFSNFFILEDLVMEEHFIQIENNNECIYYINQTDAIQDNIEEKLMFETSENNLIEKQYEKCENDVNIEGTLENSLSGSEQICDKCVTNKEKFEKMEKHLNKINNSYQKVKKQLLSAKRIIKRLQRPSAGSKTVFNKDQRKLSSGEYIKIPLWSNKTIQKALRLRFACGSTGYKEVVHNFPLPSVRTLNRRLQNLNFNNGILHEIFYFLSIKISTFKSSLDKHYMLVFDEMSITPARTFDGSTKSYLEKATIANHKGEKNIATHALVIMLAGISSRWKQVVVYYYTSDSVDGTNLKPIICNILEKAERIGLCVHSVTSNMASANVKLW